MTDDDHDSSLLTGQTEWTPLNAQGETTCDHPTFGQVVVDTFDKGRVLRLRIGLESVEMPAAFVRDVLRVGRRRSR